MKHEINSLALDVTVFAGMLLGIGGLVACMLLDGCSILAIPSLAVLLPSLVYGTR